MLRINTQTAPLAVGLGETITAAALAARWRTWARRLAATLRLWRRRADSRRALAGLTDHQLRDIGICRYDARLEGAKPFWRP